MSQPTAEPSPEPPGDTPRPAPPTLGAAHASVAPAGAAPAGAAPAGAASGVSGVSGVSELLLAWGGGDRAALDVLVPLVYAELRRQARRALRREGAGHTIQPTALVHEAFLRLVDQRRARWEGRTQFFAVAAQVMRRVLVDHARARRAAKRGGGVRPVTLADGGVVADYAEVAGDGAAVGDVDVLALDAALARLTALDPAKVRLVELRYFAGLSIAETAAALGVSPSTVDREWALARRWLRRELER